MSDDRERMPPLPASPAPPRPRRLRRGLLLAALVLSSWGAVPLLAQATLAEPGALTPGETDLAARVSGESIREAVVTLASPEMEGRGTATRGGERAARWLAGRFRTAGLEPLGDGGTYLQAIPFRSVQVQPQGSLLRVGGAELRHGPDFLVYPGVQSPELDVEGGLALAGYGVVDPALGRDDLAGLELRGRVALVLRGRPPGVDAEVWQRTASQGNVIGRLLERGAAAVVFVADDGAAGEGPSYELLRTYLTRRRVTPASSGAGAPPAPFLLLSRDGAHRVLVEAGTSLAAEEERARGGAFTGREPGPAVRISLRHAVHDVTGSNVVGVLRGSDPALREEAVVYTAHYDAWGMGAEGELYAGAADNALGTAMLAAVAEALGGASEPPRRSIVFLAVTGEEHGLLGARHWTSAPTWPLERVVANLNFDGIGTEVYAPVGRVVAFGEEFSELGDPFRDVARAMELVATPDPLPDEGAFYRSDHYAFVQHGIPALMLLGMPSGPVEPTVERARTWLAGDYHTAADTVRSDWAWAGPETLARFAAVLGSRVADAERAPRWLPGSPFQRRSGSAER